MSESSLQKLDSLQFLSCDRGLGLKNERQKGFFQIESNIY